MSWSWVWPGPRDGPVWLADGAAVRQIVGDRDHRYPSGPDTRLLEVVADGCAVEHNDVDH